MEEKLIITDEMVTSFAGMIKSNDVGDARLAVDILNNRDKTDTTSEKNFNSIANQIIDNDKLFPTGPRYIITVGDKILTLHNGTIFHSHSDAKSSLSRHLTNFLGKSAKKFQLTEKERKVILWKQSKEDKIVNKQGGTSYRSYSSPYSGGHNYNYDPNFDKKVYVEECKASRLEEMGRKGNWGDKKQYFKAIKMVFGDGPSLRDFLIQNGIVKIISI